MRAIRHVDEIDHHQTSDVAQTQLQRHLFRRRDVHRLGDALGVAVADERRATGVDVHRGERLRLLNHDVRPGKLRVAKPHALLLRRRHSVLLSERLEHVFSPV